MINKASKTRQFIIEKAAPIFNRKGIAGTAISDIMEATNLAKGGVYGNFVSKDEICMEAFNYLAGLLSGEITRSMQGKSTAKQMLFAMLDFYRERLADTTDGGCPILNFGVEADDTKPAIKQRVKRAIDASQDRISGLIVQGIMAGEFVETFDARSFAVKMFTMIEGAILISRIQNSNVQMELVTDMLKSEIEKNTYYAVAG